MYRYTLDAIDTDSFVSFTTGHWYKNVKAEKIPIEPSQFDRILTFIDQKLKVSKFKNANLWPGVFFKP
jgi:hypothetical protein